MQWLSAKTACFALGMKILSLEFDTKWSSLKQGNKLTSKTTKFLLNRFLAKVFSGNTSAETFWTSGMAVGCDTKFTWCVGENAKPLLRPQWAPSEPSGVAGHDCIAVTASSSLVQIVSKDCTAKSRFICEVKYIQ